MVLDKLINEHYQQLNDNDIHIIQMINQNIHLIHRLKIQEIADHTLQFLLFTDSLVNLALMVIVILKHTLN